MDNEDNTHDAPEEPMKVGGYLNAQELTYEQCIAYHIIGVLVLDGAIDPRNFNFEQNSDERLPYIIVRISEALVAGLEAYGWEHGVAQIIAAAQIGEMHGWKPKQRAENGGAA